MTTIKALIRDAEGADLADYLAKTANWLVYKGMKSWDWYARAWALIDKRTLVEEVTEDLYMGYMEGLRDWDLVGQAQSQVAERLAPMFRRKSSGQLVNELPFSFDDTYGLALERSAEDVYFTEPVDSGSLLETVDRVCSPREARALIEYANGNTYAKVAEFMGCTESSAVESVRRARRKLRAALA